MLSQFNFNGTFINSTNTVFEFFKKNNYGFYKHVFLLFLKRFECWKFKSLNSFDLLKYKAIVIFLDTLLPRRFSIKNYFLMHIIYLDLIYTYQGWRHLVGLPVRGQRTWSNANSVKKSNFNLKLHNYNAAKSFYGKSLNTDISTIIMAEYINFLWRRQWFSEWIHGREWLRRFFRKNPHKIKIDFSALARGLIGNIKKEGSKIGKKKKKLLTGCVGFDIGFTQTYFKYQQVLFKQKKRKRK